MHVGMADACPVLELDAQLEGGSGLADQVVFIDAERADEFHDGRDCRLAHPDDADLIRFDQTYPAVEVLQEFRHGGGRHPAGGASPDDGDAANWEPGHELFLIRRGVSLDDSATKGMKTADRATTPPGCTRGLSGGLSRSTNGISCNSIPIGCCRWRGKSALSATVGGNG